MSDIADPDRPEVGTAIPAPDPEVEAQLEQIEEGFEASGTLVGILVDSEDLLEKLSPASRFLSDQGIESETQVIAALREPEKARDYCTGARARGLKVILAGAAMSTGLAGLAAAHTDLPVIGVPLPGADIDGLDELLAAVRTPTGTPVACVAVGGAESAGALAARIINA